MLESNGRNERLVLETLRRQAVIDMEGLVKLLPHLSWNRVFQAVDSLSRTGQITLSRRGFGYEFSLQPSRRIQAIPEKEHRTLFLTGIL